MHRIDIKVETTLKQKIIKLVRLSTTKSIGNTSFSSPWISIRTGSLISIKSVCKSTKYVSQPSMSANCSLVLSLWQDFDHEWVEEVGLLAVRLVIGLIAEASF